MAKKQTRRSISVNRGVYERLKAYCEKLLSNPVIENYSIEVL